MYTLEVTGNVGVVSEGVDEQCEYIGRKLKEFLGRNTECSNEKLGLVTLLIVEDSKTD